MNYFLSLWHIFQNTWHNYKSIFINQLIMNSQQYDSTDFTIICENLHCLMSVIIVFLLLLHSHYIKWLYEV